MTTSELDTDGRDLGPLAVILTASSGTHESSERLDSVITLVVLDIGGLAEAGRANSLDGLDYLHGKSVTHLSLPAQHRFLSYSSVTFHRGKP